MVQRIRYCLPDRLFNGGCLCLRWREDRLLKMLGRLPCCFDGAGTGKASFPSCLVPIREAKLPMVGQPVAANGSQLALDCQMLNQVVVCDSCLHCHANEERESSR